MLRCSFFSGAVWSLPWPLVRQRSEQWLPQVCQTRGNPVGVRLVNLESVDMGEDPSLNTNWLCDLGRIILPLSASVFSSVKWA